MSDTSVVTATLDDQPLDVPTDGKQIEGRSPGRLALMRLKRDRTAVVTGSIIVVLMLLAFGAPLISQLYGWGPYDYDYEQLDSRGIPLGFAGVGAEHWLGVTPQLAQDTFIQLIYGIRTSVTIAVISAIGVTAIGSIIGAVAGYLGGWVDSVVSWLIDVFLSFPFLIFALASAPIVAELVIGRGAEKPLWLSASTVFFVFLAFQWMSSARLVRGQVLSLREREFVEAAKASGAGTMHIVFKQILPNVWAPILVSFSISVPALVASEAYLAFLGVGVQTPHPDLGRLVSEAVDSMTQINGWFLLTLSSAMIFLLVLTFNLFGDAVRDALNPKSTK